MRTLSLRLNLLIAALVLMNSFSHEAFTESTTQETSVPALLNLNKIIERKLAGGERHQYQVVVAAGQYIHLKVEQRGIDVNLLFYGPDGHELLRINTPNGANGPELLDFIATQAGKYRLVIASFDKKAQTGIYRVRLTELQRFALECSGRMRFNLRYETPLFRTSPTNCRCCRPATRNH